MYESEGQLEFLINLLIRMNMSIDFDLEVPFRYKNKGGKKTPSLYMQQGHSEKKYLVFMN